MPALTKKLFALLFFGLCLAYSQEVYADSTVVITNGYAVMNGNVVSQTALHFSGPGFELAGEDRDGGTVASGCPCGPGDSGYLYGITDPTNGSVVINGVAYNNIFLGGQVYFNVSFAQPLPLSFTDFAITAPFTVSGAIEGHSDGTGSPPLFRVNVTGQGLVTAQYHVHSLQENGRPIYDRVSVTYTFSPDATANLLDYSPFFVRQQYLDFLNRAPDQGGFSYWISRIDQCGADVPCINRKRIEVSAAFFVEQEFQQTGFFITRLYKASLNRPPTFAEFQADRGSVIAGSDLDKSKQQFADEFTRRAAFQSLYPDSLSNEDFVNKLFDTANLRPYIAERQARIVALYGGTETRAQVLQDVTGFAEFKTREYNPSFVLMEYFGYLRRDPDQAGYDFWLSALNRQSDNYKGMVCSFVTSAEYQKRFSPLVTHSNAECGP